ncbi:MAG: TonB-dependent receptor, partial [Campylobacterales bacterium]
ITATLSDVKGNLLSISDETALLYGIYLQESLNWERVTLDIGGSLFKSRFESSSIEYGKYDYTKGKYDYNTSIYPNQDLYTQDYTFFSPKIQAGYALAKGVNLYASLSRAQQTPSQSEISANKTYGKPDLKAATATNYEVGLKSRSKRHSLDLALYVMPIKDEIIQIYDPAGSYYANAGKTNKKGLELSASYRVTDELTIGGNYAYSNYTYDQFTESNSSGSFVRDGNYLPYIPKHQYTLMASWISPTGFKATLRSTTWGKYYVDNANSATYTPPTFITDLLVGYSKDRHDFSLNIANILDKHYASEVKKDMRTGALSYSAAPVRTIMAHYSYKF